jgi:long-subunit fatty acid transport protein
MEGFMNFKLLRKKLAKRDGSSSFTFQRAYLFIFLLSLLLSFSLSRCLYAYSSLDSYWKWGEPQRGFSARSLALGSTGIASTLDASCLYVNPALMEVGEGKGVLTASPELVWFFDKRDHSYLGTNYVTTDNLYFRLPQVSLLWSAHRRNTFILGFGYFSEYNFDYNFEEKNTSSGITDKVTSAGDFHNWVLGGSWKVDDWLSLGLSYLWGRGNSDRDFTYLTTTQAGNLVSSTSDYLTLSGDSVIVGANVKYENVLNAGLFWRSGFEMAVKEVSVSTVAASNIRSVRELPYQIGFGVNYNFNDDNKSVMMFDMIFSNWADSRYWVTKINGVSQGNVKIKPLFKNVTEYRFGFEHMLEENLAMRYGFSYQPDYPNPSEALPAVSIGAGFVVNQVIVDIGGEYAWRQSTQKRISSQPTSDFDEVTESREKMLVSLTYKW